MKEMPENQAADKPNRAKEIAGYFITPAFIFLPSGLSRVFEDVSTFYLLYIPLAFLYVVILYFLRKKKERAVRSQGFIKTIRNSGAGCFDNGQRD